MVDQTRPGHVGALVADEARVCQGHHPPLNREATGCFRVQGMGEQAVLRRVAVAQVQHVLGQKYQWVAETLSHDAAAIVGHDSGYPLSPSRSTNNWVGG